MQQPPLSQQIRALERELDVQLFYRKPRGVRLTDAGEALFAEARLIFDQLDRALTKTRRTARGEEGRVFVGLTGAAIFHPLVPHVIREYRKVLPLVSVSLEEGNPFDLLDRIEKGIIDAAFIRTPATDPKGVLVSPLLEEMMVVALPSGCARARTTRKSAGCFLKELSNEMFIDYGRPAGSWPWLRHTVHAACHAAGFNPRVSQQAPEMVSAVNLVAAGLGISIVPASLQRMNIDGVTYRSLLGAPQPSAPLNLAFRRSDQSAAVGQFIRLVQREAKRFRAGNM